MTFESDKTALVQCDEASGFWFVDHFELQSFLAAEGFAYFFREPDKHSLTEEFSLRSTKVVLYVTPAESKKLGAEVHPRVNFQFGSLFSPSVWQPLALKLSTSKRRIVKWLENCNECLVCFEDEQIKGLIKDLRAVCECGAQMCIGCIIDLLHSAETTMTMQCPNCRKTNGPMTNLLFLTDVLEERNSAERMSSTQRSFIAELMGIDPNGDLFLPCAQKEVVQFVHSKCGTVRQKTGESTFDFESDKNEAVIFKKTRAFIRRKAKAGMSRASADGSAVVKRTSNGCANCGKSFWDKRERKRAPKCLKCKRTAYCCAKCRKRHWKTHASHCAAMKPKGKRKPKRKPKKGGCAPF